MTTDILVPALGESVTEATVARWFKSAGDAVALDEPLVELETDKVTLEVNATAAGALGEICAGPGDPVAVGALLGRIEEGAALAVPSAAESAPPAEPERPEPSAPPRPLPPPDESPAPGAPARERRVRMTRLRQRIAERLKEAQNSAAMLTTFNEVDMSAVNALRERYRASYEEKHGVRLGLMGFFVKASVAALEQVPVVNAEIDGEHVVYRSRYDIGVAVGAPQGLVVPVLRDADGMSLPEIEKAIAGLARKARDGALSLDALTGGTFTITNGGVYGSLLSTPILNPPQSGILGMHKIQKRPVVVGDAVEARPMMYLALSYDHRIVDGREAVSFLVRVKECIEAPERLMLDV